MPVIRLYCVGKPDAGKLARPVWRGLGGNVGRKTQRAVLPLYAVQHAAKGTSLATIQEVLGHKDIRTTGVYATMAQEVVRKELQENAL